jgi:hypothetical protein
MSEVKHENVKYLYIGSALAVILILVMLAQYMQKRRNRYSANDIISIRTSRGLIKVNQEAVERKLTEVAKKIRQHKNRQRVSKFRPLIETAISKLEKFIEDNPKHDLCKYDAKSDIVHKAMSELITTDEYQKEAAYNVVLDNDTIDNYSDEQRFAYLLKNIDIMIQMFHSRVCDNGVVDISELEDIIGILDDDLLDNRKLETPIGQELGNRYDEYRRNREPIFIRDATILDNNDSYEMRSHTSDLDFHGLLKTKNKIKNHQTRSELFRSANNVSDGQFRDTDLVSDLYNG